MTQKASPTAQDELDIIEEAMARARLKRMRARPVRMRAKPLGKSLRAVTRKHLKGTGSPLSKLQSDWQGIVGEKLAALCRPEKLAGAKTGRTLTLKVLPAAAALIQHQSETIRQRVSVAAGGNITKLKIVQGQLTMPAKPLRKKPRVLSHAEQEALSASTRKIDNPALKAAIVALGRAVLTDEN